MKLKTLCLVILSFVILRNGDGFASNGLFDSFDVEGNNPVQTDGSCIFSAIRSQCLTPNGHGWRNELKKKKGLRRNMYETKEYFASKVKVALSKGAKTIIFQHHDDSTGTLVKIYVADVLGNNLINNKPKDGVFDVFLRVTGIDDRERTFPMRIMRSGEGMDLSVSNEYGDLTITIDGKVIRFRTKEARSVYLKFGDYLQAQDPRTGKQVSDQKAFKEFYDKSGITVDEITFNKLDYWSK